MTTTDNFIETISSRYTQMRSDTSEQLSIGQHRLLDEYAANMTQIEEMQDRHLAMIEPIVRGLTNLPQHVIINDIKYNDSDPLEVSLSVLPEASMALLLLECPALPFVFDHNNVPRDPDAEKSNEAIYSGLMVSTNPSMVQWQANVGGQLVNISCKADNVTLDCWNNPIETGSPVATVQAGDVGGSKTWSLAGKLGSDTWVQPLNAAAMAKLDNARHWKENAVVLKEIRAKFNERIAGVPALQGAQVKVVVNALFTWAINGEALPSKEDFSAWAPPRGNVLVMHSAQDWTNLLTDTASESEFSNSAQAKIHIWSERLPNIWRFTDEAGIAVLCDAMADARKHLTANQSLVM